MKIEKLVPAYKNYTWGGDRLKTKYNKHTDTTPLAESWELSFYPDSPSYAESTGLPISEAATQADIGANATQFPYFPMLIKFIDAKDNLSVQVHPSDEYAMRYENSYGKTEMWYIVEADGGAGIYLGFKEAVSKEDFEESTKTNRITELLNFYPVEAGDCFFIPSGTLHAICKGCLICEIQQNSNLTYRVYDYDRRDKSGNPRELHIDKALQVTNLGKTQTAKLKLPLLALSKYFTVNLHRINGKEKFFADKGSFISVSCVSGEGVIDGLKIKTGDTFFVPASYGEFMIEGSLTVVTAEVRKYSVKFGGGQISLVDDRGKVIGSAPGIDMSEGRIAEFLASFNLTVDDVDKIENDRSDI